MKQEEKWKKERMEGRIQVKRRRRVESAYPANVRRCICDAGGLTVPVDEADDEESSSCEVRGGGSPSSASSATSPSSIGGGSGGSLASIDLAQAF